MRTCSNFREDTTEYRRIQVSFIAFGKIMCELKMEM
jgi:hypothetical protein